MPAFKKKEKSIEKACDTIARFMADAAEAGAENILSVYMDEED